VKLVINIELNHDTRPENIKLVASCHPTSPNVILFSHVMKHHLISSQLMYVLLWWFIIMLSRFSKVPTPFFITHHRKRPCSHWLLMRLVKFRTTVTSKCLRDIVLIFRLLASSCWWPN